MARDDPQMKIRLPEALRSEIEAAANHAGRTLNSEVVLRLQDSFKQQKNDGVPLNAGADRVAKYFAKVRGQPFDDVVNDLVIAGAVPEAPAVMNVIIHPGATIDLLAAAFTTASNSLPKNTTIVIGYPETWESLGKTRDSSASQPPATTPRSVRKPKL